MVQRAARLAQAQLLVQYEARLPPYSKRFRWPIFAHLLVAQAGLHDILFCHKTDNASDSGYERSFLKHLVRHIEDAIYKCNEEDAAWMGIPQSDWVVDDALLDRYISLISQPTTGDICGSSAPSTMISKRYFPVPHSSTYHPLLGSCDYVYSVEEGKAISQGTTGLKTWEASLRLAAYLVQHPYHCAKQRRFLELGSGTGFLGLVCARLMMANGGQMTNIYLTDFDEQVLERLQESVHLSKCCKPYTDNVPGVHIQSLNWTKVTSRDEDTISYLNEVNPDCVLAADVVYDPSLVPHLVSTLYALLTRSRNESHTYALVSSTVRNPDTYELFVRCLQEKGLYYSIVAPDSYLGSNTWGLPLFPSVHDTELEGRVEILIIQAVPFPL